MPDQSFAAERIATGTPHPARMYDYYLGGSDHHPADREAAERLLARYPDVLPSVLAERDFRLRAVRTVAEAGVRQIVDVGAGRPAAGPPIHVVARRSAPDTRVVYVDTGPAADDAPATPDNVPEAPDGAAPGTGLVHADLRAPQALLDHPVVRDHIDLRQPVALMLAGVLQFVADADDPAGLVTGLTRALPQGSHLVLSHGTLDFHDHLGDSVAEAHPGWAAPLHLRSHPEIIPFFDGFELLDPGLVQVPLWRPDGPPPEVEALRRVGVYGGIGVKE